VFAFLVLLMKSSLAEKALISPPSSGSLVQSRCQDRYREDVGRSADEDI
jgi:hypothetical protein